jgi:hypothetical protein
LPKTQKNRRQTTFGSPKTRRGGPTPFALKSEA